MCSKHIKAPGGQNRPCSQSLKVATGVLIRSANACCYKPVSVRAARTRICSAVWVRPIPACISANPCLTSAKDMPTLSSIALAIFSISTLLRLLNIVGSNSALIRFLVERNQDDSPRVSQIEINYPYTAALSFLSNGFGLLWQSGRFDDCAHALIIRDTRILSLATGKIVLLWLLLTLFILLSLGCTAVPTRDAKSLVFVKPPLWTSQSQMSDNAISGWLKTFNDHQLSAFVQQGLQANFDLKAASARVAAAREQALIAGAGRLPQVAFAPSYQRSQYNVNGESGAFSALFSLSWELDVWGRIKASQLAAGQEAEAVLEDYQAARLSLAARIAQTYFELCEADLQTRVAEQSVKDRGVIVDLVRGRFTKGLTRGLDLRLVLTDVANAQAQLAQNRNNLQVLQRRLQTLLGHYPNTGLQAADKLPEPPARLAAGLPAELLERRPDIVAAFKRLCAADARLDSAHKALLPRISLTAAGGSSSPALTELIDPRAAAWNLAAGLTQPLFTGGRLQADIRLNQANVQAAFNQYQSVALNAFREVEQALAAESWLRKQEQALREAVAQTEASRKLAVYSYRQGLIEILTLLDSYRSTLNAQSAHLSVQRQLLNNRLNVYLALGGSV